MKKNVILSFTKNGQKNTIFCDMPENKLNTQIIDDFRLLFKFGLSDVDFFKVGNDVIFGNESVLTKLGKCTLNCTNLRVYINKGVETC